MLDVLSRGGYLMVPIVLCSIIGMAIILERCTYFWKARNHRSSWMEEVLHQLQSGNLQEALQKCGKSSGPLAPVVTEGLSRYALRRKHADLEQAMGHSGTKILTGLEANLRGLNIIASVAPLLGLLGTVVGMIKAFMQIEAHGGRADVSHLAGGIWEALLTTAAGLTVAIPCLLFYNYFISRVDSLEGEMKEVAGEISQAIKEGENGDPPSSNA